MKIIPLSLLCTLLALTGCSSDSKRVVDLHLKYMTANSAPIEASDANAQAQVAAAATDVSGSLEELSAIDAASQPQAHVPAPWNAQAIGMAERASIDWNGPVLPVLKNIAASTGYQLRVIGITPPIPVLVVVNANNETLADILRNVMYQIHTKASIQVYPKTRILELRYFQS